MSNARGMAGPEGLRVYWLALELGSSIDGILRTRAGQTSLDDQLRRAGDSVVLNIAEGAAHFSAGKKIYHYQLARGSAAECIAALARLLHHTDTPEVRRARRTANMICQMLTPLIRSQERRKLDTGDAPPP